MSIVIPDEQHLEKALRTSPKCYLVSTKGQHKERTSAKYLFDLLVTTQGQGAQLVYSQGMDMSTYFRVIQPASKTKGGEKSENFPN